MKDPLLISHFDYVCNWVFLYYGVIEAVTKIGNESLLNSCVKVDEGKSGVLPQHIPFIPAHHTTAPLTPKVVNFLAP